jgi:hypothetical protein
LPMGDCELMSSSIRFYGKKPRANRHRTARKGKDIAGVLGLVVVGVVLVSLLFTF